MTRTTLRAAVTAVILLSALTGCTGDGGAGTETDKGSSPTGTGPGAADGEEGPALVEAQSTDDVAALIKRAIAPCIRMFPEKTPMRTSRESTTCHYENGSGGVGRLVIHLIDNEERERLHREADSVGYLLYGRGFMLTFDAPDQQRALEAAGLLYLNCEDGFEAYVEANKGVKDIRHADAATVGCRYTTTDLTPFT